MLSTYNRVDHTETKKFYPSGQNHFITTIHFTIQSINNGSFQFTFNNKLRREI
ncbi:hypothetical protein ACFLQ4_01840 [Bacteroidota bacterium]